MGHVGRDGQYAIVVHIHSGEPEHDRLPYATGIGRVDALTGVVLQVEQVEHSRTSQIAVGLGIVSDLQSHDRVDDGAQ